MYVCMYVFMYVCVYVCHGCLYVCMYVCMYVLIAKTTRLKECASNVFNINSTITFFFCFKIPPPTSQYPPLPPNFNFANRNAE